ncbi:protein of unknown function [Rhizobiales bacterium GAS191]|nr:protein of unknown function [Rhizobiales bacterium GAS191]
MFAPKVARTQTKARAIPTSKMEPRRSTLAGHRLGHDLVEQALFLQRTIGNQATLRLLAQRTSSPTRQGLDSSQERTAPEIGRVDDPLEHEAERVADRLMHMPAPSVSAAPPQLSRKCGDREGGEEKIQKRPAEPQTSAGELPGLVHEVLRWPGAPLDAATRAYFEPRFGHDFSRVRVHIGTSAEQSAWDLNAHAYTVGHNIVFGAGRFAPGTHEGRRLIAHELAHIVQQQEAGAATIQRQPKEKEKSKAAPTRRGRLTEAEYKAWSRVHPKATVLRIGPWMPADMYKRYTKDFLTRNGFFFAGRMIRDYSAGGYDEIWLNNTGDGQEIQIYKEPDRPKTKSAPIDPYANVDPDVLEAERLVKDRVAELGRLVHTVEDLKTKIRSPEFNKLYNEYLKREQEWHDRVEQDLEWVHGVASNDVHLPQDEEELWDLWRQLSDLNFTTLPSRVPGGLEDIVNPPRKLGPLTGPITF